MDFFFKMQNVYLLEWNITRSFPLLQPDYPQQPMLKVNWCWNLPSIPHEFSQMAYQIVMWIIFWCAFLQNTSKFQNCQIINICFLLFAKCSKFYNYFGYKYTRINNQCWLFFVKYGIKEYLQQVSSKLEKYHMGWGEVHLYFRVEIILVKWNTYFTG